MLFTFLSLKVKTLNYNRSYKFFHHVCWKFNKVKWMITVIMAPVDTFYISYNQISFISFQIFDPISSAIIFSLLWIYIERYIHYIAQEMRIPNIRLLGYKAIGLWDNWAIRQSGYYSIELLGYMAIMLLGYWAIGLLG